MEIPTVQKKSIIRYPKVRAHKDYDLGPYPFQDSAQERQSRKELAECFTKLNEYENKKQKKKPPPGWVMTEVPCDEEHEITLLTYPPRCRGFRPKETDEKGGGLYPDLQDPDPFLGLGKTIHGFGGEWLEHSRFKEAIGGVLTLAALNYLYPEMKPKPVGENPLSGSNMNYIDQTYIQPFAIPSQVTPQEEARTRALAELRTQAIIRSQHG